MYSKSRAFARRLNFCYAVDAASRASPQRQRLMEAFAAMVEVSPEFRDASVTGALFRVVDRAESCCKKASPALRDGWVDSTKCTKAEWKQFTALAAGKLEKDWRRDCVWVRPPAGEGGADGGPGAEMPEVGASRGDDDDVNKGNGRRRGRKKAERALGCCALRRQRGDG